ncbi:MAG TPA: Ig-like domain repeat protein [Acidimicrobiales bacterium]|nr:Ig-like domain repeat protein [Acidimicrobiales bacterium]
MNGDSAGSLSNAPSCSKGTKAATPDAGSYTTSCSGALDPNYTIGYVTGMFTVQQAATTLKAGSVSVNPVKPGATVSATLTRNWDAGAIAGQSVSFYAKSTFLCSAITNSNGAASCTVSSLAGTEAISNAKGYTAEFAGTTDYKPSSGNGSVTAATLPSTLPVSAL